MNDPKKQPKNTRKAPRSQGRSAAASGKQRAVEIARRIEGYRPKDVPETWDSTIRPFVVTALRAAEPQGTPSVEQWARVLTLISSWCVAEGIPLDIERVLDPDTVERFTSTRLKGFPSRHHYRTVLRRLGRRLTKRAPWPPRPEPMKRRKVALPYSATELDQLWEDAQRQSSPPRRRTAMALICLGAGAGIDGRWCTKVRGTDVRRLGGVVVVQVNGPSPREVPVLERFEEHMLRIAEEAGDDLLIGPFSQHRNRTYKIASRFEPGHGHPNLSVKRLRSTWIVEHLSRGTRVPELLAAAGTSRVESIDELLEFVPPLDAADARQMLRGGQ